MNKAFRTIGKQDNDLAELLGIEYILRNIPEGYNIEIIVDSMFAKRSFKKTLLESGRLLKAKHRSVIRTIRDLKTKIEEKGNHIKITHIYSHTDEKLKTRNKEKTKECGTYR